MPRIHLQRLCLFVLAFLLGLVSFAAHARKAKAAAPADDYVNKALPDNANVWHCWYDGRQSVLCKLGETAATEGAARPVDPRLPEIVRTIWQKAGDLAETLVSIPLHTDAADMALTGELAESVMCGGANGPCGVIFAANLGLLSMLVEKRNRHLAARKLGTLALAQ